MEEDLKNRFLDAARERILLFCATGDQASDAKPSYPAKYGQVMALASANSLGLKSLEAEDKNVQFYMPTEGVKTEGPSYLPNKPVKGSSAATAVAAGLASLILTCARFAYHDNQPAKETSGAAHQPDPVETWVAKFKKEDTMRKLFEGFCHKNTRNVQPERFLSEIPNIENLQPDEFKAALRLEMNRWLKNAANS